MDYTLSADETLIRLLQSSDETAFKTIYNRYWEKLFLIAYRKMHSLEAAEEVIQDIFISLWNKRASNNILNLEAYLITAVKYRVISFVKAEMAKKESLVEIVSEPVVNNTNSSIAVNDLKEALQKGIDNLPQKTAEIFTLSRLHHLSVREIAQKLDISEKAVEYHITQSLRFMRVYLKDFLLTVILFSITKK